MFQHLHIIDFSYGHTGCTHDATAWEDTQLEDGEWVWADSAYPVLSILHQTFDQSY